MLVYLINSFGWSLKAPKKYLEVCMQENFLKFEEEEDETGGDEDETDDEEGEEEE